MTWLFSRALCESLHSSQEQGGVSSEAACSDGEPFAQLNVMPTQHKFSRNDKTMDVSRLSQFGLTLRLLTEDHGEELLTSFRAGFRAKTYPLQGEEQESEVSGLAYGQKWPESSVRYDRDTSSWKTHQCLWDEDLPRSSVILPNWGMTRNGFVFQHPTAERPISETVSGLWPTPNVPNGGRSLAHVTEFSESGRTAYHNGRKVQVGLEAAVKMWPTPVASMHKGSSPASLTRKTGKSRENDRLDHAVMASDGGQLNPTWVEWLMGWPINWTSLKSTCKLDLFLWEIQHAKKRTTNEKLRTMQWPDDPSEMGKWEIRLNIQEQEVLLDRMQSAISVSYAIPGESCRTKARPKNVRPAALCEMRNREVTEASQGRGHFKQFAEQYRILVRQLPCCASHSRGELGQEEISNESELRHLWNPIPAEEGSGQALQGEVLFRRNGEKICRTSVGIDFRSDRLKAIGNGQVPRVAAVAFNILKDQQQ